MSSKNVYSFTVSPLTQPLAHNSTYLQGGFFSSLTISGNYIPGSTSITGIVNTNPPMTAPSTYTFDKGSGQTTISYSAFVLSKNPIWSNVGSLTDGSTFTGSVDFYGFIYSSPTTNLFGPTKYTQSFSPSSVFQTHVVIQPKPSSVDEFWSIINGLITFTMIVIFIVSVEGAIEVSCGEVPPPPSNPATPTIPGTLAPGPPSVTVPVKPIIKPITPGAPPIPITAIDSVNTGTLYTVPTLFSVPSDNFIILDFGMDIPAGAVGNTYQMIINGLGKIGAFIP